MKYHDLDICANLFQPLYCITKPNEFLLYSIPSISKLDEISTYNENNTAVISLENNSIYQRYTFSFIISSINTIFENSPLFLIDVPNMYKLSCTIIDNNNDFVHLNEDKFIYFAPTLSKIQKLLKNEELEIALKKYYQKKFDIEDSIFFPPNKQGCFRIIFDVPMRIKPEILCEFVNNNYRLVECDGCSNKEVRFKIKHKSQNYKYLDCIKSIAFSTEL